MPLYFFNVRDGFSETDDLGTELPDIYAAQMEAVRFSGEVLSEMGARFWDSTEWVLEVRDETEDVLFVLRFSAEEPGLDVLRRPESDKP